MSENLLGLAEAQALAAAALGLAIFEVVFGFSGVWAVIATIVIVAAINYGLYLWVR